MRSTTMGRAADFSPCGTYRYSLRRVWNSYGPKLTAVLLNPSVADAERDDPTTTFMVNLARRLNYGRYEAVNLFALVSTDPNGLLDHPNPTGGAANERAIMRAVRGGGGVVVAWGGGGDLLKRGRTVADLLQNHELWCLGHNAGGAPRFPRAVRSDVAPVRWRGYDDG